MRSREERGKNQGREGKIEREKAFPYYNSPAQVKPEELKWDVCLALHAPEKMAAPLKKGECKYPLVAEVIYKGPYDSVSSAYPALMQSGLLIPRGA
jgi:hypothetical protein